MKMQRISHLLLGAMIAGSTFINAALAQERTSLLINVIQIFGTIDPAKINDYTEYMAGVNLYDALTTVDANGNIIPQLAERWSVSDDNLTYTFTLKADATFQDGSKVEAKDVVYSIQRLLTLNEGPSHLFSDVLDVNGVSAVDDKTVKIQLKKVYSPFISNTPIILILNADLIAEQKDGQWGENYVAENPVGAGPYKLSHWTRGSEMKLTRYENYHGGWNKGTPIDEVRFVVTRDEATVKALATSGELGMTTQYQSNETYKAIAALDNYQLLEVDSATIMYMKLNNQSAPTDDIHIRKAIAYAIDYATIRNIIYPGGEAPSSLAPIFKAAYLDTLKTAEFNLEKAAEEVAKSKYANQKPIKLSHTYVAKTAFEEEVGLLLKSTLESIGFEVSLQPEPWNRITELASSIETTPNTTQVFYGPTYPSPDSVFYVQYHSKAKGTWSAMDWVMNDEIDALIDQARALTDTSAQNAVYKTLQQKLNDMVATIPLLTQRKRFAMNKCLKGYEWVPMQSWDFDISKMTWECP